jgi:hypothetical protein
VEIAESQIVKHSGRADRFLGIDKGLPISVGNGVNSREQPESLIDETESSFDLKRVIIRRLVLLVRGREEVRTRLRTTQIEIYGHPILSPSTHSGSGTVRDDSVSVLITSNRHEVLPGQAEVRQDDRQVDARCGEQYGLQLAWLLAAIGGRIPEIDSFRDRLGLCERLLLLALIARPCNESGNEDDARRACKRPGQLPSRRLTFLAQRQKAVHAVGTSRRMIDARVRQSDAFGPPGESAKECLIRTWPGGSRLPGEYPSLVLLHNPFVDSVLGTGGTAPA